MKNQSIAATSLSWLERNFSSQQRQKLAGALTAFTPIALVLGRSPADIVISIVAVIFFADSIIRRNWSWMRRPWIASLLLLWLYSVVRACFVPNIMDSAPAAFVWLRYIVFAAGASTWTLTEEVWRRWLIRSALIAAAFLSLDAIFQFFADVDIIGRPRVGGGRLTAIYKRPIVGMTVAGLFALPLFYLLQRKNALASIFFGSICFIAVLLSGERMALLFSASVLLFWFVFLIRTHRKLLPLVIAIPCILIIFAGLKTDILQRQIGSTLQVAGNIGLSAYGLAWSSAAQVGEAYPVFGVGTRQFRNACLEERFGPLQDVMSGYNRCYAHPHNIFLEWFSEDGLIGLGGFVICIVIMFADIRRRLSLEPDNLMLWGTAFGTGFRLLPVFASTSFFNNWAAIPYWLGVGWIMCETSQITATEPLFPASVFKRFIDITVASVALILCSPLLAMTAIAVRLKLGSPVLFRQQRPGKDGKLFTLYKFRSMLPDGANEAARLSPFGKCLRATSLDELPELWNVLKGDMSLIGPRPLLSEYLPYYSDTQRTRHAMRPGLTGLAQVKGRNLLNWDERLALDAWYVSHWSLWLDLKIALATVGVVLKRQGINAEGEATMPRFDDFMRARQKGNG